MKLIPLLVVAALAADSYSSSQVTVKGTHTNIRVESNGEVKTYDSDQPGNMNIESSDGSAKASANVSTENVNSDKTTSPIVTPKISKENLSTSPTATPSPTITPEPETISTETTQTEQLNIFEKIKIFLQKHLAFLFK